MDKLKPFKAIITFVRMERRNNSMIVKKSTLTEKGERKNE